MTSAKIIEMSVITTVNSPSQDFSHPPEQTTCWLDWTIDEKRLQDYYHVLTGFITGRLSIQEQLILGSNPRLYLKQWQLKVFVSCSNKCEIQQVNNIVK